MLFYLGTYTQRGGAGVLGCELGAENAMRVIGSVFLKDPTYVIANARRDRLFCVCEAPAEGEEGGSAASFSLGEDGAPVLLSRQNAVGRGPCHLCLSPDERFLYLANYVSGSVSVFPVEEGGRLGAFATGAARGPRPQRGSAAGAARASGGVFAAGKRAVLRGSRGGRAVYLRAGSGHRTAFPERSLLPAGGLWAAPPGEGRRQPILLGARTGKRRERIAARRRPVDLAGNAFHPARANRGHDSIAVFAIEGERLRPLGIFPTPGPVPRDFYPLKDGRVLIAHQEGDVTLARLAEDGFIPLSHLDVRGAVCVLPFEEEMA